MKGKSLILIVLIWIIWKLIEHYLIPYFFVPFLWLGLSLILLIVLLIQIAKLIKERKSITKMRIVKTFTFSLLFILGWTFDEFIEKIDFYLLYNKRMEIVNQIKENKLTPNVSWNDEVCQLPYKFPIVSHGGNDIVIRKNEDNKTLTVTFFVFRRFNHSTKIIYTTRSKDIKYYEAVVLDNPQDNWKIENNWYRIGNVTIP